MAENIVYKAADAWLKARLSVATRLGTIGIAEALAPDLRAQAFFSAKIAEARIVEALRAVSDDFSRGTVSLAEARTRLKEFLADDPAGGDYPQLAKTGRLNLVLNQNRRMAQAVGRHEVAFDPDVLERWPYYRYIAGPNPRDSHRLLDGMILPKTDPFWATHTPPWEFNCNCDLEEVDADEAASLGGVAPHAPKVENSADGFRFNPADAFKYREIDSALPDDLQRKIRSSMEGVA